MNIRFVPREEIEKVKWDSCVHYANNGNPFGYTWYLDNVAREWDGLVEGDYESVFPLIKRKNKKVAELYIPDLLPKAGLYSIHGLSKARIQAFLSHIPSEYGVQEIAFIRKISLPNSDHLHIKNDYQLNLSVDYDEIQKNYTDKLRQGLDHVHQSNYIADASVRPEDIADFYLANSPRATEEMKHSYLRIIYNFLHRGTAFISTMKDEQNQMIAADVFAYSHGKVISLIPSYKGEEGKFALWKLLDLIFQTHSGKPNIFDFNTQMGCNMHPEVFRAETLPYSTYKIDQHPSKKKWWQIK